MIIEKQKQVYAAPLNDHSDNKITDAFNLKEFEANFDGRESGFLNFLNKDSNKELYQIVKSKSSELVVS